MDKCLESPIFFFKLFLKNADTLNDSLETEC